MVSAAVEQARCKSNILVAQGDRSLTLDSFQVKKGESFCLSYWLRALYHVINK